MMMLKGNKINTQIKEIDYLMESIQKSIAECLAEFLIINSFFKRQYNDLNSKKRKILVLKILLAFNERKTINELTLPQFV